MRTTALGIPALALVALVAAAATPSAERPLIVSVDARDATAAVSPDFIGLSFEMATLLPDAKGTRFFAPSNRALLRTFQTLGIRSLRVGGNTADRPTVPVPGERDVDSLFAFVKAARVKVIYTLRLREGSREAAARIAKYISERYDADLACFAIGNEPNVFAKDYPVYLAEWRRYVEQVAAPGSASGARFCGPSATPGKVSWASDFVRDVAGSGRIAIVTQHDYPGSSAREVKDAAAARRTMLSADWVKGYQSFHDAFVPTVRSLQLPYRLEEANSFFHGGAKDVSDTFASALWALDYMYWWASHQAHGINFHTGDSVAAGEGDTPCRYAAFWTSSQGYSVHPIGYALKAFDLGSHGRLVPVTLDGEAANVSAYGVLGDGALHLTLINRELAAEGGSRTVRLTAGASYGRAQVMALTAPFGDTSATAGVTLGGSEIAEDASWDGRWTELPISPDGGFTLGLPAASAAVVKLLPRR